MADKFELIKKVIRAAIASFSWREHVESYGISMKHEDQVVLADRIESTVESEITILNSEITTLNKRNAEILNRLKEARDAVGQCNLNVHGTSRALEIIDEILNQKEGGNSE